MNYLESALTGKNSFWRYLVMLIAVMVCADFIGSLPLFIAIQVKAASNPAIISGLKNNPADFGMTGLDKNILFVLMFLPFVACLAAFVLLVKPINGRTFSQIINGTGKIRWNRYFISGLIWMLLSGIYLIVYLKIDPSNFTINNKTITLLYIVIMSFLLVPFQAGFEEILFRGYLMQGFAVLARNRWFPLIITSVLFAIMHSFNPEVRDLGFLKMMPQYLIFGLGFGIVSIMDDGIEAAMGAHTANNIFLCILITNKSSAIQTSALYEQKLMHPMSEFIGLFISVIVFIAILGIIYKWKDFTLLWGQVIENRLPD